MSLIKEIINHATIAWSPLSSSRMNLFALGSKEGVGLGFDNYGGELQIYNGNFTNLSLESSLLGSIRTKSRFNTIQWNIVSKYPQYDYGILAGGMADSTINLYDPKAIMESNEEKACIGQIRKHKSSVLTLQFNPHIENSHLLASGGADNEVYIMTLDNLATPMIFTPYGKEIKNKPQDEITCVAWNTQVSYILATGTANGSVIIWDLKQKQPWCELKEVNKSPISTVLWNPKEGLHMITASLDRSVIRLWDLRSSTSTPLAELNEHTDGILSASWCPHDAGYLLSCGKDNRTILWDLFQGQKLHEIGSTTTAVEHASNKKEADFFSGQSTGQRRFNIQWSTGLKSIASTCTFDGKVQLWNLSTAMKPTSTAPNTTAPPLRAPKWYKTSISARLSFGGKLVTTNPKEKGKIQIYQLSENPRMVENAIALDNVLKSGQYREFCQFKIDNIKDMKEKEIWLYLKALFEENPRQYLLEYLGFKPEEIRQAFENYLGKKELLLKTTDSETASANVVSEPATHPTPVATSFLLNSNNEQSNAEDIFGIPRVASEEKVSESLNDLLLSEPNRKESESKSMEKQQSLPSNAIQYGKLPIYTEENEKLMKNLLIIGDFHQAVECCLQNHQYTEALLLSTCGGEDLWKQVVDAFLNSQKERELIQPISAILNHDFATLIESSDVKRWKETLAMLCTFAVPEEFAGLCEKLGSRLEKSNQLHTAVLCYVMALSGSGAVRLWKKEYQEKKLVGNSTELIQELIEKASILVAASNAISTEHPSALLGEEISSQYLNYAMQLVDEGRYDLAIKYVISEDKQCKILKERLYYSDRSGYVKQMIGTPAYPFDDEPMPKAAQSAVEERQQQAPVVGAPFGGSPGYPTTSNYTQQQQQQPTQQQFVPRPTQPYVGQQTTQMYSQPSQAYSQPAQGYSQPPAAFNQTPPIPSMPPQQVFPPSPGIPQQQPLQTPNAFYGAPPAASVGVNSVAAAAASQGKFAKPATDIAKHQSDGFVSSVGNKELSMKYGNQPGYVVPPREAVRTPFNPTEPVPPFGGPQEVMAPNRTNLPPVGGIPPVASPHVSTMNPNPTAFSTRAPNAQMQPKNPTMGAIPSPAPVPGPSAIPGPQFGSMKSEGVNMPSQSVPSQYSTGANIPSATSANVAQPPVTTFVPSASTPNTGTSTSIAATTATPKAPEPVLGATEKINAKDMAIVHAFNGVVGVLDRLENTMGAIDKRQLLEAKKAKDVLFMKLNTGVLSPNCIEKLHEMSKCFEVKDWISVHSIHVGLTTSEWNNNKDWLRGVKALITLCKKYLA